MNSNNLYNYQENSFEEIGKNPDSNYFRIENLWDTLKMPELLRKANIKKESGFNVNEIFFTLMIFGYLKVISIPQLLRTRIYDINAPEKDTFYRFKNNERYNWTNLLMHLFIVVYKLLNLIKFNDGAIIVDSTVMNKTGKKMELVSYIKSSKDKCPVLGYEILVICYQMYSCFFPICFKIKSSKSIPDEEGYNKETLKNSNGSLRRKDAKKQTKLDMMLEMIKYLQDKKLKFKKVIFDSWFAFPSVINQIKNEMDLDVICRIKLSDKIYQFVYKDKVYTVKNLYKHFARKHFKYISSMGISCCRLSAKMVGYGEVTLVFSRDFHEIYDKNKADYVVFLSTDLNLCTADIIKQYARRWSIEVFFKEIKNLFGLGKDQGRDFDSIYASIAIVFVRYTFVSLLKSFQSDVSTVGTLFEKISQEEIEKNSVGRLWELIYKTIMEFIKQKKDYILEQLESTNLKKEFGESLYHSLLSEGCET